MRLAATIAYLLLGAGIVAAEEAECSVARGEGVCADKASLMQQKAQQKKKIKVHDNEEIEGVVPKEDYDSYVTKEEYERNHPQGDGGPQSFDMKKEFALTEEDKKAGTIFLRGKAGPLTAKFMHAMRKLIKYYTQVIKGKKENDVVVSKEKLRAIFEDWCGELAAMGEACSADPLEMESSMGFTKCQIEEQVNAGHIPADVLALAIELMDPIEEIVMPTFELSLKQIPNREQHACEIETNSSAQKANSKASAKHPVNHPTMPTLMQSQAFSQRQSQAVAAVSKIRQAANDMAQAPPLSLGDRTLQALWREPCQTLGCDPRSFLDIVGSMHGHAAELIEVAAPAHVIREHLFTIRHAIRLLGTELQRQDEALAGNSSSASLLQLRDGTRAFYSAEGRNDGNLRYEGRLKGGFRLVRAAAAQIRSKCGGWLNFELCLSVGVSKVHGLAMKLPNPLAVYGAILSLSFSYGFSYNAMKGLFEGKNEVVAAWALKLSVLIGFIPTILPGTGPRAGVAGSVGISGNGKGKIVANFGASLAGGFVWPSTICPGAAWFSSFGINCMQGVSVGVGVVCSKVELYPNKAAGADTDDEDECYSIWPGGHGCAFNNDRSCISQECRHWWNGWYCD